MNKYTKLLPALLFCFCFLLNKAYSQETAHCTTSEMNQKAFDADPKLYADYLKENARLAAIDKAAYATGYKDNSRSTGIIYTFPVVFHIIHNNGPENISDTQVKDAFRILQEDYRKLNSDFSSTVTSFKTIAADCEIEFCLATKDPSGNATTGIVRTVSTKTNTGANGDDAKINPWPTDKYINIWIVSSINGSGSSGFTYYPTSTAGNVVDGIVLRSDYTGSIGTSNSVRTHDISHEMGHYFNLIHIWGPSGNCGDDLVSDTPTSAQHNWINNNCQTNDQTCQSGVAENTQNYMDYTFCYTMFTQGQKTRMQSSITGSASRTPLWQSANLAATGCSSTTGVGNELSGSINFNVYPNPVDENTIIKFNLIEKQKAELKIYDVLGQQVACVFKGELNSGEHQYPIGNKGLFKSGIYFVKLIVGDQNLTKKIIIQQ